MSYRFFTFFSVSLVGIAILAVVLAMSTSENNQAMELSRQTEVNYIELGGQAFMVEMVATPAERAQGLSGRDPLEADQGMLFVFEDSARHGFWMKGMKFALDIIWVQDDEVVDIWPNAQPPSNGEIPSYMPEVESNYVLEVNAGFVESSGLKIGDKVSIAPVRGILETN